MHYYIGMSAWFYNFDDNVHLYCSYISEISRTAKLEAFVMALETSAEPIRSRFSIISQKTKKWIETMLVRLQPFIKWPGREELLKKMPLSFKTSVLRFSVRGPRP